MALRTLQYVAISLGLSLLIGYPVAYYIARHAGRTKALLLILVFAPLWINYLMRMLAWVNLLAPGRLCEPVPRLPHILGDRATGWEAGRRP